MRVVLQAAIVPLLLAAAGCGRDEVTHVRVPKSAQASPPPPPPQPAEISPPPAPGASLSWTLPKGWKQQIAGGMRYATLTPSSGGRVEVSVVVLPGPAGGELANVNRWRGQLGLPPIGEPGLPAARAIVRTQAGPFSLYDIEGEGKSRSRMIAALGAVEGSTWFIKMLGDAPAVGAARADFLHLLEGLRVDGTN